MAFKMTRAEAEAHQRRHGFLPMKDGEIREIAVPTPADRMNKTEREYSVILEAQKRTGEIVSWRFEGMRLAWGYDPRTDKPMWYKPDFVVILPTTVIWPTRIVEVKGPKIWDRDIVRFKGARAEWPEFQFEMWQRDKQGRWTRIH